MPSACGSISGMIRWACHIPLGYYMVLGMSDYNFVKKHADTLLLPPLGRWVLTIESFAGPGGIAQFVWNFLTFVVAFAAEGTTLFLLGVVDSVFVVLLAVRLHSERRFVGLTHGQCNSIQRNGTADPKFLFFERAWQTNLTSPDLGRSTCKNFLAGWYTGLAILILYSISAFVCVLQLDMDDGSSVLMGCIAAPFIFVRWLFGFLPLSVQGVPRRMRNSIVYWARYSRKWVRSKVAPRSYKLIDLNHKPSRQSQEANDLDFKLSQLLSVNKRSNYDILQNIAQNLDYVDLVHLSLVSKRTRNIMFPPDDEQEDDRQLRFNSCSGNKKSRCWICAIQICQECTATRGCKESNVWYHMQNCQVKCTDCFRNSLSNNHGVCKWQRPRGVLGLLQAPHSGYIPWLERQLCQDCNAFSEPELLSLREKRDRAIYERLAHQPFLCSTCSTSLPRTGPRWWVCSKCSLECREDCHPGWNQKATV